jgi:putative acetyltransferase
MAPGDLDPSRSRGTAAPELSAVVVRPVLALDVPAIVDLLRTVLTEFGLRFGEGSASDASVYGLPESYEAAGGAFWVAVDISSGTILGTCGLMPIDPALVELQKMYLRADARGRGVGRHLLDEAVGWARSLGMRRIVLDTAETMVGAIRFYEKNGFLRDDSQIRGSRCSRGYVRDL